MHGLNFAPEEIGIGKYSGEMVADLLARGAHVKVVTAPPYYPQWKIHDGFSRWYHSSADCPMVTSLDSPSERCGTLEVTRCPLWVPGRVNGWKRVLHLASFGLSSIPPVLWKAAWWRPDVIITVEPAAFCMPTTLLAARLCGAKAWLHVQDFEVDAAFELGILKQPLLKKIVLAVEGFLMRRFDRVSSISPNMVLRLRNKGVPSSSTKLFPNWVDCQAMRPLEGTENESSANSSDLSWNVDRARRAFNIPEGKCVALYAGNIGAKQGLELIVEAARRCQHNDNLHFVVCGAGAARETLEASAQGMSNLQLLPLQPFEVFNELMNCADIHMLPQKGDAADLVMPSKLTGMLATGRPVVACASPGTQIAAAVEGCGCVVLPGDVAAFSDALEALSRDAAHRLQLGRAARQYAVDYLSRPSILGRFYADLCETIGIEPESSAGESPSVAAQAVPPLEATSTVPRHK